MLFRSNSFHGSEGNIYSRTSLHENLGYEHYYGGQEIGMTSGFIIDRELMNGYDKMVSDDPFYSFIITYSGHGPYYDNDGTFNYHSYRAQTVAKRSEPAYIYAVGHAMETDYFIGLLLAQLEADGLMENTALIFYADHYNYYMMNDALNMDIKGAENLTMPQNTDFFIYSKDLEPEVVDTPSSSMDEAPTICNLFGFKNPEEIGRAHF